MFVYFRIRFHIEIVVIKYDKTKCEHSISVVHEIACKMWDCVEIDDIMIIQSKTFSIVMNKRLVARIRSVIVIHKIYIWALCLVVRYIE